MANKRTRTHYDDDDGEYDNGYARHNKVSILSRVNGDSLHDNSNHILRLKSSYRGDNRFSQSGTRQICLRQPDGECSLGNDQSNNNFGQRNYYNCGPNGYVRNPSLVLQESKTGWYAIHVHNVTSEYDAVIKVIQQHIMPIQFYPYNIHFTGNAMIFVIDDFKTARTLQNFNCEINFTENRKLTISVRHYWPRRSTLPLTSGEEEKIAQAIASRYNPNTKRMDLSQFHASKMFSENKLFLPLNRRAVFLAALEIAAEYLVYDLSLENNQIFCGKGLKWIQRYFPELKVLNLSDNKLTDLKHLESLRGFNIEDLNLSNNPVDDTQDDECSYNWNVQEMFPVLKKFGNMEFQSRYSMVADTSLKMPVNCHSYYAIPEGLGPNEPNPMPEFSNMFLKQYFDLYDNEISRHQIGVMYHDDASFSLSSSKPLKDTENQNDCLHNGPENIVNFLEKLPKTKHDLGSFQIHVPIANSESFQININGVFVNDYKESNDIHELKHFSRKFCFIRNENQWRIISDRLLVTQSYREVNTMVTSPSIHQMVLMYQNEKRVSKLLTTLPGAMTINK